MHYGSVVKLALGSNLGNRLKNLDDAVHHLTYITNKTHSNIIEVEALLLPNSPTDWNKPYLNMVVIGSCLIEPLELLQRIKATEQQMGRDLNAPRWSPRIIDIDILEFESVVMQSKELTIPHPQLANRSFLKDLLKEFL